MIPASAAERAIIHENGHYWVLDSKRHYAVMVTGNVCSVSESAYAHDAEGLSLAIARCDYLAKARP